MSKDKTEPQTIDDLLNMALAEVEEIKVKRKRMLEIDTEILKLQREKETLSTRVHVPAWEEFIFGKIRPIVNQAWEDYAEEMEV